MGMGGNGNGNGFMGMGGNGNRNSPSRTPLVMHHTQHYSGQSVYVTPDGGLTDTYSTLADYPAAKQDISPHAVIARFMALRACPHVKLKLACKLHATHHNRGHAPDWSVAVSTSCLHRSRS